MKNVKNVSRVELAAVGFMVFCCAQPATAGNTTQVAPNGYGWVQSDVALGAAINDAQALPNWLTDLSVQAVSRPASGVNSGARTTFAPVGSGYIAVNSIPAGCAASVYAQATTVFLTGGYKAQARSYYTGGATVGNGPLEQKLASQNMQIKPTCGGTYDIASGGEDIGGKHYLVVYGTAGEGAAAWFRGFGKDGNMLYEVLLTGPFDFGGTEPTSVDPCKALKVPFTYNGPIDEVIFRADTLGISANELINGFDAPIGGTGGSCSQPLAAANVHAGGTLVPIKFAFTCGGMPDFSPICRIQPCNDGVPGANLVQGNFRLSGGKWTFAWNISGLAPGTTYRIVALMPNDTPTPTLLGEAYIRLKSNGG